MYKFNFLIPLINFECDDPTIKLSENIKIRKATNDEQRDLRELASNLESNLIPSELLLDIVLTKKKPESIPHEHFREARHKIENALAVLRLYRNEPIGFNLIIQPRSKDRSDGLGAHASQFLRHYILWSDPHRKEANEKYYISGTEVKTLKDFFSQYYLSSINDLDLAIAYFNKSYIEPYTPRDSFLDVMIALENLYLRGIKQELGYKLRTRISVVLASEFEQRKAIFRDIKKAYEIRGRIVHGEKVNNLTNDFLDIIRDYTKKSFMVFIKRPELVDQLDDIVLKGGLNNA